MILHTPCQTHHTHRLHLRRALSPLFNPPNTTCQLPLLFTIIALHFFHCFDFTWHFFMLKFYVTLGTICLILASLERVSITRAKAILVLLMLVSTKLVQSLTNYKHSIRGCRMNEEREFWRPT